jgi:hypothetical protein
MKLELKSVKVNRMKVDIKRKFGEAVECDGNINFDDFHCTIDLPKGSEGDLEVTFVLANPNATQISEANAE